MIKNLNIKTYSLGVAIVLFLNSIINVTIEMHSKLDFYRFKFKTLNKTIENKNKHIIVRT